MAYIPEMPSVCKVYFPFTAPVLVYSDVPCRLVPTFWGGRARATLTDAPAFSHYVDIPANTGVINCGLRRASASDLYWTMVDSESSLLVVCHNLMGPEVFICIWAEERYVDTEYHHRRIYLQRVGHWSDYFPDDPCG